MSLGELFQWLIPLPDKHLHLCSRMDFSSIILRPLDLILPVSGLTVMHDLLRAASATQEHMSNQLCKGVLAPSPEHSDTCSRVVRRPGNVAGSC